MSPRYLIFLRRHALLEMTPELLSEAASISRADANRVLRAKTPLPVRVCDSRDRARETLLNLRGHGIEAFAVASDKVRAFRPRPLHRIEREAGALFWCADRPDRLRLRLDDLRMIVVGKIHRQREVRCKGEAVSGWMYGDPWGAGLAYMGQSPVGTSPVSYETSTVSRDEESFCCLFRGANEAYVVMEERFEYRGSLPRVCPTREQSFLAVVALAREVNPNAVYDDTLYRAPAEVRMFGDTSRNIGSAPFVNVISDIRSGSTEERRMGSAYLLYLQAFGGQ